MNNNAGSFKSKTESEAPLLQTTVDVEFAATLQAMRQLKEATLFYIYDYLRAKGIEVLLYRVARYLLLLVNLGIVRRELGKGTFTPSRYIYIDKGRN